MQNLMVHSSFVHNMEVKNVFPVRDNKKFYYRRHQAMSDSVTLAHNQNNQVKDAVVCFLIAKNVKYLNSRPKAEP